MGTTDSATGFSARVSQYARSPSRSAQVGKSWVRIKPLQWGASRIVGVGVEKSLRTGRRALRWVSIESSEYRLDFRRKSTVNLWLGAGCLGKRGLGDRGTSQDDCVEADCGGVGKGCRRRWWVRYGPRCHCGSMMTKEKVRCPRDAANRGRSPANFYSDQFLTTKYSHRNIGTGNEGPLEVLSR